MIKKEVAVAKQVVREFVFKNDTGEDCKYTYTGAINKDGVPHGTGTWGTADCRVTGMFREGVLVGDCVFAAKDGALLKGKLTPVSEATDLHDFCEEKELPWYRAGGKDVGFGKGVVLCCEKGSELSGVSYDVLHIFSTEPIQVGKEHVFFSKKDIWVRMHTLRGECSVEYKGGMKAFFKPDDQGSYQIKEGWQSANLEVDRYGWEFGAAEDAEKGIFSGSVTMTSLVKYKGFGRVEVDYIKSYDGALKDEHSGTISDFEFDDVKVESCSFSGQWDEGLPCRGTLTLKTSLDEADVDDVEVSFENGVCQVSLPEELGDGNVMATVTFSRNPDTSALSVSVS